MEIRVVDSIHSRTDSRISYAALADNKMLDGRGSSRQLWCCCEADVEDLEQEKQGTRISPDQYINVPEIPAPRLMRGGAKTFWSVFRFLLAVCLPVIFMTYSALHQVQHGEIEFGVSDSLDLDVKNCDVRLRGDSRFKTGGAVTFRTWRFMGLGSIAFLGNDIHVSVKNERASIFWNCEVQLLLAPQLLDGQSHVKSLSVTAVGNGRILFETAGARDGGNGVQLAVADTATFSFSRVRSALQNLQVKGAVRFNVEGGDLVLYAPTFTGDLEVMATAGALLQVQTPGSAVLSLPKDQWNLTEVCGAQLKEGPQGSITPANSGERGPILGPQQLWEVPPHGNGPELQRRSLSNIGPLNIRVFGDGTAMVYVAAKGSTLKELQNCPGSARKTQMLAPYEMGRPMRRLQSFLDSKGLTPSAVYIQLLCPSCRAGVWQLLGSKAFLALGMDWYALLTAGVLYPRSFEVDFRVTGTMDGALDEWTFLEKAIGSHDLDGWIVCWLPADGSPRMIFEEDPGTHHRRLRPVHPSDVAVCVLALAANILAAIVAGLATAAWLLRDVAPYVHKRLRETKIEENSTHRLSRTERTATFWIFACLVEADKDGKPSHGVMLNWRRREEHSAAAGFTIQFRSQENPKTPQPHEKSFFIPKIRVSASQNNPNMEEYIVQSSVEGGHLRVGKSYKFMLRAVSQSGHTVGEASAWTALVQITPPSPITDYLPMLMLKAFCQAPISSLAVFANQIERMHLKVSVELAEFYVGFRPVEYDALCDEIGGGMCVLEIGWLREGTETEAAFQESTAGPHLANVPLRRDLTWSKGGMTIGSNNPQAQDFYWHKLEAPLELLQTSTSQEELWIRLRTSGTLREIFCTRIRVRELMRKWEHVEAGLRSATEVAKEAEEQAKMKPFTRDLEGFSLRFCPVFVDSERLWCPLTPYGSAAWGQRNSLPTPSSTWLQSPFRSLMPSEMVMQGTRKVLTWDVEAMKQSLGLDASATGTLFNLELRPVGRLATIEVGSCCNEGSKRNRWYEIAKEVDLDRAKTMWRVQINEEMQGRFVLVAVYKPKKRYSAASIEFFVNMPLTLQEFELAYGAFCRAYELPMQQLRVDELQALGHEVVKMQLAVCQDLRPVFPVERSGDQEKLKMCKFPNAQYTSSSPLTLLNDDAGDDERGQGASRGFTYRSGVQVVEVLDGGSWKLSTASSWAYDALIFYNLDLSWKLTEYLSGNINPLSRRWQKTWSLFQDFVHAMLEVLLYLAQFWCLSVLPFLGLILLAAQQYFHFNLNPTFRLNTLIAQEVEHRARVTDWLASPGIETLRRQRPEFQIAICAVAAYMVFMCICLVYMNFLRDAFPRQFKIVDNSVRLLLYFMSLMWVIFVLVGVMWLMLASLIVAPERLAPLATMLTSGFLTTYSLADKLMKLARAMRDIMQGLVDRLLNDCLTEFINSRPELRNAGMNNPEEFLYFGTKWSWDKKGEDFCRALCDQGQKVPRTAYTAQFQAVEEEVSMAYDPADQKDDFGLSANTRMKLDICFQFMVNKIPLPPGLEQSLQDVNQLAMNVFETRDNALNRLLSRGEALCIEISQSNVQRHIDDALASVLRAGPNSRINVLDIEQTSRDTVLFYDKTLMELIRTHVRSTINVKLETLLDKAKLSQSLIEKAEKASATGKGGRMSMLIDQFQLSKPVVDMKDAEGGIDVSDMDNIRRNLLPRLETLGLLGPSDLRKLGTKEHALQPLVGEVMQVTGGDGMMRREHLVELLLRMIDKYKDGKVDHLWHGAYRELLEELYLCPQREIVDTKQTETVHAVWVCYGNGVERLEVEEWTDSTSKMGWTIEKVTTPAGDETTGDELRRYAFVKFQPGYTLSLLHTSTGKKEEFTTATRPVTQAVWVVYADGRERLEIDAKKLWTIESIIVPGSGSSGAITKYTGTELQKFSKTKLPAGCELALIREGIQAESLVEQRMNIWGRPVTVQQAEQAWDDETGDHYMLDLDRVEDVILTHLTSENGVRKLWPEAFVLMARYLHIWPEVPFEDACVAIDKGTQPPESQFPPNFGDAEYGPGRVPSLMRCVSELGATKYFSTVMLEGQDRPLLPRSQTGVSSYYTLGSRGLVYAYSEGDEGNYYGEVKEVDVEDAHEVTSKDKKKSKVTPRGEFATLGSFKPSEGFGFLQTNWYSLATKYHKKTKQPWITLIWDQDAQKGPKTAPFEGPLEIFIVFLNLDPSKTEAQIHQNRRWVLSWKREESFEMPALKGGDSKWRGFDMPTWASECHDMPRHEVRSKKFGINPDGENNAILYGLGEDEDDINPVLIFVKVRREEFPDVNSFQQAAESPFKRSDFFYQELWNPMDQAEAERKAKAADPDSTLLHLTPRDTDASGSKLKRGGGTHYPNSWFIDLAPDGTELLRKLIMDENPGDPGTLKELGEGLFVEPRDKGSSLWYKGSGVMSRLRGLWFDAFEELLVYVGLQMDKQSAWSLWRRFSSAKEKPVVAFGRAWNTRTSSKVSEPGGIIPVRALADNDGSQGVVDALEGLMEHEPFLSDATFLEFNYLSNLHLDEQIAKRLYLRFCEQTPNYAGAKNLIAWPDLEVKLREHITKKNHQLEVVLQGDKEPSLFCVGGIWFDPLYNVVITCMPEVPSREQVEELYKSYVDQKSGLCPLSKVYDVIAKLGRPGLKFEQFQGFVTRLGMNVDPGTLLRCFQRVDVEQNNVLDNEEMKSGMNLLFEEMVPDLILKRASLQLDQVAFRVLSFLLVLTLIFVFLELSFAMLMGPQGGSKLHTLLQSILAAAVAAGAKGREDAKFDANQLGTQVRGSLEYFVGNTAQRSMADDAQKKKKD